MKQFFTLCIALFIVGSLHAQKEPPVFSSYHKNIYAELLGSHILAGVNFDMRLNRGRMDGIGFRAGIGGISVGGTSQGTDINIGLVTFPLEFNHLVGKRRSSLVTGVGILPIYATASADGQLTNYQYLRGEGFGIAGGFLTFGYRLQPLKNGFTFQFNWNPLILRGSGFNAGWIGIGIGIGFK